MRAVALALSLITGTFALAPAALGAGIKRRISATPSTVRFGHVQTVVGHQWTVNEFCRRTVRLTLRSGTKTVDLGTARVRDSGTFTRHWTPRRGTVAAGAWQLQATLRCESGKDGSTIYARRAIPIHVH